MIKQLSLTHYRSIRSLELKLGQLNVITGPNGCGKSNLNKAVRLLHEATSFRLRWRRMAVFRRRCGQVARGVASGMVTANG